MFHFCFNLVMEWMTVLNKSLMENNWDTFCFVTSVWQNINKYSILHTQTLIDTSVKCTCVQLELSYVTAHSKKQYKSAKIYF